MLLLTEHNKVLSSLFRYQRILGKARAMKVKKPQNGPISTTDQCFITD
jgi:hypothetical protein